MSQFDKKVYRVDYEDFFQNYAPRSVRASGLTERGSFFCTALNSEGPAAALSNFVTLWTLLWTTAVTLKRWFVNVLRKSRDATIPLSPEQIETGDLVITTATNRSLQIVLRPPPPTRGPRVTEQSIGFVEFKTVIFGTIKDESNGFSDLFMLIPDDYEDPRLNLKLNQLNNQEILGLKLIIHYGTSSERINPLFRTKWDAEPDTRLKLDVSPKS